MGLYHSRIKNIEGLSFYKLLGTGKKPGFRVTPDFKTYALLTSWKSEEDYDSFNFDYKIPTLGTNIKIKNLKK